MDNASTCCGQRLTGLHFFAGLAFIAIATFLATVIVSGTTQLLPPRSSQSVSQIMTNKDRAFNVSGEAKIDTIPDEARVSLGVTAKNNTVKGAQDKINQSINSFTAALKELGIEKEYIKTANYSLYPEYDYSDRSQGRGIIGYTADTSVIVTIKDFNQVNQVIDLAAENGLNSISGLNFTLSDEKEAAIKKEARAAAIADAKKNATELTGPTGMKLGRIIDIYENNSFARPMPVAAYNYDYAMKESASLGADVQAGSTTYTYSVTLSYETL